jgi:Ca-activated chloride channel family protein
MGAQTDKRKKINTLLFLLTIVGGFLWAIAGEALLRRASDLNDSIIVGAYFAGLFGAVVLACYVSEFFVSSLVPRDFFLRHSLGAAYLSIPAALALVFFSACLFQFIYGLEITQNSVITDVGDYYFIIDDSGSMMVTDPLNKRIGVINDIASHIPDTKRMALVKFTDFGEVLLPLSFVKSGLREELAQKMQQFRSDGNTGIVNALNAASRILDSRRNGIAILVTDGDDNYGGINLEAALAPYIKNRIPIFSIFLGSSYFQPLILGKISMRTGGRVVSVDNIGESPDFEKEVMRSMGVKQIRNLLKERSGATFDSSFYRVMRIVMITLMGLLLGYSLAFVFQYRSLGFPLSCGGVVSGIFAAFLLEFGIQKSFLPATSIRIIHDVILSTVVWTVGLLSSYVSYKIRGHRPFEWYYQTGWLKETARGFVCLADKTVHANQMNTAAKFSGNVKQEDDGKSLLEK